VPIEAKGDRDRVLVTDTDLVLVTDTLGDLELGFLDRERVRVTEPVRERVIVGLRVRVTEPVLLTVRVQGSVPCVCTGVLERVLVTEVVLVRVTDTVGLLVRVTTPDGRVLVTEGDLELGSLVFERVMVTDLVRVTELVRERVTVGERV
jgi:hypothetical protein